MATPRRVPFARHRVPVFTVAAGVGCALLMVFAGACSDGGNDTRMESWDAAPPPPPGACSTKRTATPLCVTSSMPEPLDAGELFDAGGGGGDASPQVPLEPPESANLCLISDDVTVTCASQASAIAVAGGANDATDIVLAQVGLGRHASSTDPSLVADDLAHVQHVRVGSDGVATVSMDPVPPYPAAGIVQGGSFALLPASDARDTHILAFTKNGDGAQTVQSGALVPSPVALGAPFAVPGAVAWEPRVATGPGGEGVLFAVPRGGPPYHTPAGPLVVVRGLPDAPRVVATSVTPISATRFAATVTPAGVPAVLFHDGATLRLREGDDLANERWSEPLEREQDELYDVVYAGGEPVVLSRSSSVVGVRAPGVENAAWALGESFSTCPRNTYVGVTCDECPVDRSCHVGRDIITQAKLFTRGERVFAAFVATDQRQRMGYARTTLPIVNAGCVCSLERRELQVVGRSLVVVEVTPSTHRSPFVTEWMRVSLAETSAMPYAWLFPRRDGDLDVVLGRFPATHETALARYPEAGSSYRFLRIATGLIP